MTINFTNEEMKTIKSLVRMELEEEVRALNGLSKTPANISRIKYLQIRVAALEAMLAKMCEA